MLLNALLMVFGFTVGGKFADIDLAPPLMLRHRSFWTHGPLVPAACLLLSGAPEAVFFSAGFLPAYAVHLVYDMLPRRWHGGAKISLHPLPGRLAAGWSFLWLGAGALAAVGIWLSLVEPPARALLTNLLTMIQ